MTSYAGIYKECLKAAFAKAAAYRLNFMLSLVITLLGNALFPLFTILIYNSGAAFPGWSFYEALLIQSVFMLSNGLASMVFGGVLWATMGHIREGSFETVLIKPVSPLFFLISSSFEPESLGLVLGGIAVFAFAVAHTGTVSVLACLQFAILFIAGFAVMAGIYLTMAATSFKWVGNSRLPEIFESIQTFGKYPSSVFPKLVRNLTAFVIPVGMIGFFPASALLGRLDAAAMLSMIPCFLFMLFGIWLYRHMIRLYEGVGG